MKRLFFILISILLILSCKINDSSNSSDSIPTPLIPTFGIRESTNSQSVNFQYITPTIEQGMDDVIMAGWMPMLSGFKEINDFSIGNSFEINILGNTATVYTEGTIENITYTIVFSDGNDNSYINVQNNNFTLHQEIEFECEVGTFAPDLKAKVSMICDIVDSTFDSNGYYQSDAIISILMVYYDPETSAYNSHQYDSFDAEVKAGISSKDGLFYFGIVIKSFVQLDSSSAYDANETGIENIKEQTFVRIDISELPGIPENSYLVMYKNENGNSNELIDRVGNPLDTLAEDSIPWSILP